MHKSALFTLVCAKFSNRFMHAESTTKPVVCLSFPMFHIEKLALPTGPYDTGLMKHVFTTKAQQYVLPQQNASLIPPTRGTRKHGDSSCLQHNHTY